MEMIDYIYDQPNQLKKIFERKEEFLEPFIYYINKNQIKKIYITGSGTSYHASLIIKMYLDTFTNFETVATIPTHFTNYTKSNSVFLPSEILVLSISQSGTSTSTIDAVKKGNKLNYKTVALTEDIDSLITKSAELSLHLNCGKELIPIETRGYTSTVLTGLLMAIELGKKYSLTLDERSYEKYLNSIYQNIDDLNKVFPIIEDWYQSNKKELVTMEKGAIAGYGFNYVTAHEAHLKLYETFHQPISSHDLEEMIHGYEMAFDCKQYVFYVASQGSEIERIPKFKKFIGQLTQYQFIITDQNIELTDRDLLLPIKVINEFSPILFILPFQIMAARNCESIGYDTSVYPHKTRSFSHIR